MSRHNCSNTANSQWKPEKLPAQSNPLCGCAGRKPRDLAGILGWELGQDVCVFMCVGVFVSVYVMCVYNYKL